VAGLQSAERAGIVALPLVSDSALTALNIHSPFLLHANFYKWSLHLLNSSPLTSLCLNNIDLSPLDWSLILPALTIPTLASLTIGPRSVSIVVPDLDLFLTRHPSIHTLDLSFHTHFGAHSLHSTTCALPRLATLRATPAYLLYFLGGADAQGWYPDLRLVAVTWNDESGEAQFARIVGCIETRRVVPRMKLIGNLANRCQVPAHLISPTK
jgi:hypothetical protein